MESTGTSAQVQTRKVFSAYGQQNDEYEVENEGSKFYLSSQGGNILVTKYSQSKIW